MRYPRFGVVSGWTLGWLTGGLAISGTGGLLGWQKGGLLAGILGIVAGFLLGGLATARSWPGRDSRGRRFLGPLVWITVGAAGVAVTWQLALLFSESRFGPYISPSWIGLVAGVALVGAAGGLASGLVLADTRSWSRRCVEAAVGGVAGAVGFCLGAVLAIMAAPILGQVMKSTLGGVFGRDLMVVLGFGVGCSLGGVAAGVCFRGGVAILARGMAGRASGAGEGGSLRGGALHRRA